MADDTRKVRVVEQLRVKIGRWPQSVYNPTKKWEANENPLYREVEQQFLQRLLSNSGRHQSQVLGKSGDVIFVNRQQ